MTSYHLARSKEGWSVVDSDGHQHGTQPTRSEGRKLLQIVRHLNLARLGFLPQK